MTTMNQTTGFFLSHFGMTPNAGQSDALNALAQFIQPDNTETCFILTGPAGSGKTSLLRSVIAWFDEQDLSFSLAAPTGRAAQIAGKKAGCGALTPAYLFEKYQVASRCVALQTVERTHSDSYILENAQHILGCMKEKRLPDSIRYRMTNGFSSGITRYLNDFSREPFSEAVMIALSNNQVNALNTWARKIRHRIENPEVILPGESMICNNNMEVNDQLLYKGSHFLVKAIWHPEELAGLNFLNAEIEFDNHRNERVKAKTKIMIDSVTSQDGSIPYEKEKALLHEAYKRNRKFRENKQVTDDAFVNSLGARYGYALTAHKAQGGEWKHVSVHPGYRKNDLRWIYTAVTRAKRELFTWNVKSEM